MQTLVKPILGEKHSFCDAVHVRGERKQTAMLFLFQVKLYESLLKSHND